MTDDDARWAEALAILADRPTESPGRRLRRDRHLAITTYTVCAVVVAMVVVLLFLDGGGGSNRDEDVPTWLAGVGYSLGGLGLVIMVVGLVLLRGSNRSTGGRHSPVNALTFRQRQELQDQLRGRAPVVPGHAPLVGHLAEGLLAQRIALLMPAGQLLSYAGLWIAIRSTWSLVLVVLMVATILAGAVFGRRQTERARRLLDQHHHPAPDAEPDRG